MCIRDRAKEDREALQKVLNDNPRVNTEPDINGEELPEWVALEKEIKALSEQLPACLLYTSRCV